MTRRRRGLGIAGKLLLFSLTLLLIPWLGYRYLQEMRTFLLSGQEKAQLLAAQAVATALHDSEDLLEPHSAVPPLLRERGTLYAYPLPYPIQLDGYLTDWGNLTQHAVRFDSDDYVIVDGDNWTEIPSFELVLGTQADQLYALLRVHDNHLVYRHPGYSRLDTSDHLRLTLLDDDGALLRFVLVAEGPGAISAYRVDEHWRHPLAPHPVPEIKGYLQENADGYDVELRLPRALLGPDQRLHLAVADVDDPHGRKVEYVIGSLHKQWPGQLNPLVKRSLELQKMLAAFDHSSARIWVIDRRRNILAAVGGAAEPQENPADELSRLDGAPVDQALGGLPATERRRAGDGKGETILAAQPVYADGAVVGAVVIEQGADEILSLQRHTFERITRTTLLVLLLSVAGVLLFASRLTWRIRRLSAETAAAIDPGGRVVRATLRAEHNANDDLGELSRSISDMLARLQRYTRFLENMPRTLRHEINNPLNVISTSLQNLADELPQTAHSRYMQGAERGIARLGRIVQSLTEAASLEEALRNDERQVFDLAALVRDYVESCAHQYPERRFTYQGPTADLHIEGTDVRIEQLLDKLVDNAVDFTPAGGEIRVTLDAHDGWVRLSVSNDGPALPEHIRRQLFDSMISVRDATQGDKPHLGMGLYVARTIAEHHGGRLEAADREDGAGAVFTVHLPLARQRPQEEHPQDASRRLNPT